MMERTLYVQAESPKRQAVLGGVGYTGTELEREEIHRIAVGQQSRYPLFIGVIDEERMGVIKDSLRVIDTIEPD